jgi:hypothetical protein
MFGITGLIETIAVPRPEAYPSTQAPAHFAV